MCVCVYVWRSLFNQWNMQKLIQLTLYKSSRTLRIYECVTANLEIFKVIIMIFNRTLQHKSHFLSLYPIHPPWWKSIPVLECKLLFLFFFNSVQLKRGKKLVFCMAEDGSRNTFELMSISKVITWWVSAHSLWRAIARFTSLSPSLSLLLSFHPHLQPVDLQHSVDKVGFHRSLSHIQ